MIGIKPLRRIRRWTSMANEKKSEFFKRRRKAYLKRWIFNCLEKAVIVLVIALALFGTFVLGLMIAG